MIDFKTANKIAKNYVDEMNENAPKSRLARLTGIIPEKHILCESYGETPKKYVFISKPENGSVPPGGGHLTVDKETGECQFEYLEREGDKPWSPIKGYRRIEVPAD